MHPQTLCACTRRPLHDIMVFLNILKHLSRNTPLVFRTSTSSSLSDPKAAPRSLAYSRMPAAGKSPCMVLLHT